MEVRASRLGIAGGGAAATSSAAETTGESCANDHRGDQAVRC